MPVQPTLNDVSLNFQTPEFVTLEKHLRPSGEYGTRPFSCGKFLKLFSKSQSITLGYVAPRDKSPLGNAGWEPQATIRSESGKLSQGYSMGSSCSESFVHLHPRLTMISLASETLLVDSMFGSFFSFCSSVLQQTALYNLWG